MHSPLYKKIKTWYDKGIWTKEMVYEAVPRLITAEEYEEITGEQYIPSQNIN